MQEEFPFYSVPNVSFSLEYDTLRVSGYGSDGFETLLLSSTIMQLYSGFLLKTTDNKLLLQQRDNKPDIANPGMIAIFGGTAEVNEIPTDCAKREAAEEVGLSVSKKNLKSLGIYQTTVPNVGEVESHVFLIENVNQNDLHLNEGESIFVLDPNQDITTLNLTPVCRQVLTKYLGRS